MSRDKELGSENGSEIRPGETSRERLRDRMVASHVWDQPIFWRSGHWLSVGVKICGKLDFFCGKLGFLCGKVGKLRRNWGELGEEIVGPWPKFLLFSNFISFKNSEKIFPLGIRNT